MENNNNLIITKLLAICYPLSAIGKLKAQGSKLLLVILTFIFLISSVNSATQNIQQCPTTWNSGDTYVLDVNYVASNCFVTNNSVTITSNGIHLEKDLVFNSNGFDDLVINNLSSNSLSIKSAGGNTANLVINNSKFTKQNTFLIADSTLYTTIYLFNIVIQNTYVNYITNTELIGGSPSGVTQGGINVLRINGFKMIDSEILGASDLSYELHNSGGYYFETFFEGEILFDNNVLGFNTFNKATYPTAQTCNFNINSNNFLGWINVVDSDTNYLSDNVTTLLSGNCLYYNSNVMTRKNSLVNNSNTYYNYLANTPNYYENNKRIFLLKSFTLDGLTTGIDLTNVQNTIIDLTHGDIVANNVRVIKLGNNNGIDGGNGNPRSIRVGQLIPTTYTDFYSTNYHLIEYSNKATINNINFALDFAGVSVLRKDSVSGDGIDLTFTNNIIDLNYPPDNELQPMIVFGCKATIKGNTFDMFNIQNQSVLGDGRCNSGGTQISGGHLIQDNVFTRGGIALRQLYSGSSNGAVNLKSKFNHNSFTRLGTGPYAKPVGGFNLWIALPEINNSYFYDTLCQNYEFNLGNYYQSVFDNAGSLGLTDSNGDGIYDQNLNFNTTDLNNVLVFDRRALTSYPYDFAGQIGTNNGITNTCGSLSFNIIEPQDGMVYPATTTFNTNWEFNSPTYSNLECSENFNGEVTLFSGVNSGDNKGITYGVSSGTGNFQVQCCDTPECDNVKITSNPVSFQIGALTSPIVIGPNPVINPNPGGGGGNGGSNQTNYTQTGNGTQYYDTNVIDFSSVDNTNQNTASFLQDIMGFVVNVGIPTGVLIVVIVSVLAILRLLV